jgi:hypothetical protein
MFRVVHLRGFWLFSSFRFLGLGTRITWAEFVDDLKDITLILTA